MHSSEPAVRPEVIRHALSPEALQERASSLAQLDDFGSTLSPVLDTFRAFFGDLRLTSHGLLKLTTHAIRALVTRLRWVEGLKQTPRKFSGPLNQPLIIVGLPRTGTSYLQQLLSCLPQRRVLTFWEAREPIPDAHDDDRISRYEHLSALARQAAPELAFKHPIDVHEPEECMFLLDPSMVSLGFAFIDAPCRGYSEWVHDASHREPYDIYRQLLLYLQSDAPERRFVLKSPSHFSQLSALLRAVPEARLIHTHRDPVDTLASTCSIRETVLGPAVADFGRKQLGQEMLAWFEDGMARNAAQREQIAPGTNFDLQFDELTRQPLASIQRLYRYFGLDWREEEETALRAELSRGKPPQVGRHHYDLRDYGLDSREVAARLEPYRRRWGFA